MRVLALILLLLIPRMAWAGPPFITDDPAPVDLHHTETFFFNAGTWARNGTGGASGIDFNYGALPDLHINIAVPVEFDRPKGGPAASGFGNIELAAKYRFLHQETSGWDVAVYPRLILPSASDKVGEDRAAVFLPLWAGRNWGDWSTYGGGGCTLRHGGDTVTACQAGWVLSKRISPRLQLGGEIVHAGADAHGGRVETALGAGLTYDLNEHYHLLAYAGPQVQNVAENGRYNWYVALQSTF